MNGSKVSMGRRGGRGERAMVPDASFSSYYGRPVIKEPSWQEPDIAGYLYLGGLAGASSAIALGAQLTRRPALERASKIGALAAIGAGMVGLLHDLGRPARFVNMLRVFKPTSPMNMGSWLLSAYGPAAGVSALTAATGRFRRIGGVATAGAAALGPLVASYTAALICDTAVPSWHEGFREMPFVFVGSAATAAGGLGMVAAPTHEAGPARRAALLGGALEVGAARLMERRMGDLIGKPYREGGSGQKMRIGEALTAVGAVCGATLGRRSRVAAVVSGAALLTSSALTRVAIFEAGVASAREPAHTVVPQRERLGARQ